ncbi:HAD family hydrolase [Gryllotalpicola daejeonensis]|uniref:HAD family hydrolase n=1 Tax=Gryllotalpicola daejeonensis TaxID=993087 RepID=A0ABP7ZF89_9MICO
MSTSIRAVLFDIDGTLVDSNYLHVAAWHRAFQATGEQVDAWRIHRGIGQDSATLLSSLVGERSDEWVEHAKSLHTRFYEDLASRLRVFDGARELITELDRRGVRVVLATSAPEDELSLLTGLLAVDDAVYATTSADDVDTAKPDPDIIGIALERAGVGAAEAIMIGDAVWDMKASRRAGVTPYAVLSGGVGAEELREAGAQGVFEDARAVLEHLGSLLGANG